MSEEFSALRQARLGEQPERRRLRALLMQDAAQIIAALPPVENAEITSGRRDAEDGTLASQFKHALVERIDATFAEDVRQGRHELVQKRLRNEYYPVQKNAKVYKDTELALVDLLVDIIEHRFENHDKVLTFEIIVAYFISTRRDSRAMYFTDEQADRVRKSVRRASVGANYEFFMRVFNVIHENFERFEEISLLAAFASENNDEGRKAIREIWSKAERTRSEVLYVYRNHSDPWRFDSNTPIEIFLDYVTFLFGAPEDLTPELTSDRKANITQLLSLENRGRYLMSVKNREDNFGPRLYQFRFDNVHADSQIEKAMFHDLFEESSSDNVNIMQIIRLWRTLNADLYEEHWIGAFLFLTAFSVHRNNNYLLLSFIVYFYRDAFFKPLALTLLKDTSISNNSMNILRYADNVFMLLETLDEKDLGMFRNRAPLQSVRPNLFLEICNYYDTFMKADDALLRQKIEYVHAVLFGDADSALLFVKITPRHFPLGRAQALTKKFVDADANSVVDPDIIEGFDNSRIIMRYGNNLEISKDVSERTKRAALDVLLAPRPNTRRAIMLTMLLAAARDFDLLVKVLRNFSQRVKESEFTRVKTEFYTLLHRYLLTLRAPSVLLLPSAMHAELPTEFKEYASRELESSEYWCFFYYFKHNGGPSLSLKDYDFTSPERVEFAIEVIVRLEMDLKRSSPTGSFYALRQFLNAYRLNFRVIEVSRAPLALSWVLDLYLKHEEELERRGVQTLRHAPTSELRDEFQVALLRSMRDLAHSTRDYPNYNFKMRVMRDVYRRQPDLFNFQVRNEKLYPMLSAMQRPNDPPYVPAQMTPKEIFETITHKYSMSMREYPFSVVGFLLIDFDKGRGLPPAYDILARLQRTSLEYLRCVNETIFALAKQHNATQQAAEPVSRVPLPVHIVQKLADDKCPQIYFYLDRYAKGVFRKEANWKETADQIVLAMKEEVVRYATYEYNERLLNKPRTQPRLQDKRLFWVYIGLYDDFLDLAEPGALAAATKTAPPPAVADAPQSMLDEEDDAEEPQLKRRKNAQLRFARLIDAYFSN